MKFDELTDDQIVDAVVAHGLAGVFLSQHGAAAEQFWIWLGGSVETKEDRTDMRHSLADFAWDVRRWFVHRPGLRDRLFLVSDSPKVCPTEEEWARRLANKSYEEIVAALNGRKRPR